jgi:alpha-aminoadipic semialdehyde synthase
MYRAVADARLDVTRTGLVISDDGIPKSLGPLIFCITGDGNVSRGALHILKCLPHEWVLVKDLKSLVDRKDFDNHKVYILQVTPKDYLTNEEGGFDYEEYKQNPERYTSNFHSTIAPYVSFILNGIFWTEKYPRLMTIAQTKALALQKRLRLLTLADVSCDINVKSL